MVSTFSKFCLLLVFIQLVIAIPSNADKFIPWSKNNVQILKGWDYEAGDSGRTILTLEHANEWRYGDFFAFIDGTRFDDGGTTYYFEPSLRLSLSKLTGAAKSAGLIKDLLITTNFEYPEHGPWTALYGLGLSWTLPGFVFFNSNFYLRDNPDLNSSTWQVTVAWNRPFTLGRVKMLAEGFADFAGKEEYRAENQLIVPRILADLGELLFEESDRLFLGIEWQYWHNKFGIKGVNESVPQVMIKWVL